VDWIYRSILFWVRVRGRRASVSFSGWYVRLIWQNGIQRMGI
jgi:hypothetical protein